MGFQTGHHVLHAAPRVSGHSHLEIGSVGCKTLNRGIITVERDHCVIFSNKAACLSPVSWVVRAGSVPSAPGGKSRAHL